MNYTKLMWQEDIDFVLKHMPQNSTLKLYYSLIKCALTA